MTWTVLASSGVGGTLGIYRSWLDIYSFMHIYSLVLDITSSRLASMDGYSRQERFEVFCC